ncbi:hypothetical protein EMA8858_00400 [Emticicia aquatica]|jgi:hypothetical protein|uniref:Uncharacterized protein n=1 Tax=Emticicia aquatica TaxID=1681835 RepID=A0ABM9AKP6_9BACT|nr:hypothetical protein EMA8858_00400 [Emticicia aquatica]
MNIAKKGNFISSIIKNVICLIQESTEVLFYCLCKISIFVSINYNLIT